MGTLGLLFIIEAISSIKDEMRGSGFHYAQAGVVFLIVGFSAVIVESSMMSISAAAHVQSGNKMSYFEPKCDTFFTHPGVIFPNLPLPSHPKRAV